MAGASTLQPSCCRHLVGARPGEDAHWTTTLPSPHIAGAQAWNSRDIPGSVRGFPGGGEMNESPRPRLMHSRKDAAFAGGLRSVEPAPDRVRCSRKMCADSGPGRAEIDASAEAGRWRVRADSGTRRVERALEFEDRRSYD